MFVVSIYKITVLFIFSQGPMLKAAVAARPSYFVTRRFRLKTSTYQCTEHSYCIIIKSVSWFLTKRYLWNFSQSAF